MPAPVMIEFTPLAQWFAGVVSLGFTCLLSLAVWYLKKLDRHIAFHKHKGCMCDTDGQGEAYFSARYD
jgi:cytochrome oxidase assembly protein ShyY1